ncbi:hypothetical protein RDMS_03210 [Deinococcus sp. RL]|uniref:YlxR family protein n=1 Tax=Deinococcus sp. RL TaxID=1489678 RepID=UPI0004D46807|nr:YlxR family protein [Deinococcus sp. RL]KEF35052.1 hypothetical protein RDMS_03210 [Deinococcus sp. RL]
MPPASPPHVPQRTCVACRTKRPQAELLRVSRDPAGGEAGGWRVAPGGARGRTGRGAYVCPLPECWSEKRLRRAFRGDAPAVSAALHAWQQHP